MTTCPRLLDDSARRIRPAISGWPRSLTIPAAADQGVPLPPSPGKRTREKSRLAKPRTLTCTGQRRTSGWLGPDDPIQVRQNGLENLAELAGRGQAAGVADRRQDHGRQADGDVVGL